MRIRKNYASAYQSVCVDSVMKMYFQEKMLIIQISKEMLLSRMSIYRWIHLFRITGKCLPLLQIKFHFLSLFMSQL